MTTAGDKPAKDILVVLTNAKHGREQEFNRWYDAHIGDLLKIDGISAAIRFSLADTVPAQECSYRYLAIYEIAPGRREDVRRRLAFLREERAEAENSGRPPVMPVSDTLDDDRIAWWFTRIEVERDAVTRAE